MDEYVKAGDELRAHGEALAEAIVARQYQHQRDLWQPYGAEGRAIAVRDALYHLDMLADSTAVDEPSLFVDYVDWAKVLFHHRGLPAETLDGTLNCTSEVVAESLSADTSALIRPIVQAAIERLPHAPTSIDSFLSDDRPYGPLAQKYLNTLLQGDRHTAGLLIGEAIAGGARVDDIYMHVFQPCQWEIGRLWQMNQISVADEHYCTAATQLIMSQLYGHIFSGQRGQYSLLATCVGEELHEMGARMVADLFELNGWDTHYLGANMPPSGVIAALEKTSPDVLAISTTLVSHVTRVRELIERVRDSQQGPRVKILVGGRPFIIAKELWRRVGADAGGADALEALRNAQLLLNAV